MNILEKLKKIAVNLERKNDAIFSYPVDSQEKYINSLNNPKNDFERAYYQYKCQMELHKKLIVIFINVASLPFLFYFYFKPNKIISNKIKYDAIFLSEGISEDVIPDSLREKYKNWKTILSHGEILDHKDKHYFTRLCIKYPISWHFLLKCLIKLRMYSHEIKVYTPSAIIVCGEYSFTSSFLTNYCEENGVTHVNVMHGEKLFFIRDSFFRFHQCYVWDKYYIELFDLLRASKIQFIVDTPRSIKFIDKKIYKKSIDFTYYLAAEDELTLKNISFYLERIAKTGVKISVRPHPRYSNIDMVKKYFNKFEIENTSKIDIQMSISRTRNVISLYSTVLNQAHHNQVNIIIDDISNPTVYISLKKLRYIVFDYNPKLLSNYM